MLRVGAERATWWGTCSPNQQVHSTSHSPEQKKTVLLLQTRGPAKGKFSQSYNQKEPKGERECTLCSLMRFIDESLRVAGVINHTIKAGVYLDRGCGCRRCNTIKADSMRTSDLLY